MSRPLIIGCVLTVLSAACGAGGGFRDVTIEEASAAGDGTQVAVTGFVVEAEGVLRVCQALAESFPPQCRGASLTVEGLSIEDAPGVQSTKDTEFAPVSWTNQQVVVSGSMADGILRGASFGRRP